MQVYKRSLSDAPDDEKKKKRQPPRVFNSHEVPSCCTSAMQMRHNKTSLFSWLPLDVASMTDAYLKTRRILEGEFEKIRTATEYHCRVCIKEKAVWIEHTGFFKTHRGYCESCYSKRLANRDKLMRSGKETEGSLIWLQTRANDRVEIFKQLQEACKVTYEASCWECGRSVYQDINEKTAAVVPRCYIRTVSERVFCQTCTEIYALSSTVCSVCSTEKPKEVGEETYLLKKLNVYVCAPCICKMIVAK